MMSMVHLASSRRDLHLAPEDDVDARPVAFTLRLQQSEHIGL